MNILKPEEHFAFRKTCSLCSLDKLQQYDRACTYSRKLVRGHYDCKDFHKVAITLIVVLFSNSSDVGTGLYGAVWKKIGMSFLHDYFGRMVIPGQFYFIIFQFNYLIF